MADMLSRLVYTIGVDEEDLDEDQQEITRVEHCHIVVVNNVMTKETRES